MYQALHPGTMEFDGYLQATGFTPRFVPRQNSALIVAHRALQVSKLESFNPAAYLVALREDARLVER